MVTDTHIPPGYKHTEVGVIPEEWEAKKFGELATPRKERVDPKRNGESVFCIELEHIEQGTGHLIGSTETTRNSSLKSVFYKDDVLFGKLRAYLKKYWKADRDGVCSTEIWALISKSGITTPSFVFQIIKVDSFIELASLAYGTHMPRSDWRLVKEYPVALPTKKEQEAIAGALSDADTYIAALEQVIAKKQAIKQGAMQDLLTGKKRLPGFAQTTAYKQTEVGLIPEDWGVKIVSDVSEVKTGPFGSALHGSDYKNVGTPIITVEHIGDRGIVHQNLPLVSDFDKNRLSAYALKTRDIVFSRVGSVDRNAIIKMAENGWLFSGRLLRVRITNPLFDAQYLSYHFHTQDFKNRVLEVAVGQTMASINTKILSSIKIIAPPTLAEQTAIATVLSDMDAELAALEEKLSKARALKQGMMHVLLTGKIRLI